MSAISHIINHSKAGLGFLPAGANIITAGKNANFPDIQDAIDSIAFSDLVVARTSQTHVITATNGSATVTGVGIL